jgi:lipopolysaccharide export LptBFGC system permease protein LptF
MNPRLKEAIGTSVCVAIIYTIVQIITPYLFSSFDKHPFWVYLIEGFVFFLFMLTVYYYDNRKKKR